jgi:hypothetical protein
MDSAFRVNVIFYLREALGIKYVNIDQLQVDSTRPNGYLFGTHRFVAHPLPDGTYRFQV